MNNSKMAKSAKTFDTVIGIIQKILLIVMAIILFGGILLLFWADSFFNHASKELTLGSLTLRLSEGANAGVFLEKGKMFALLISSLIILGITYYGITLIREILKPIKDGRPFDNGVAEKLKKLGWVILGGGLLSEACDIIAETMLLRTYNIANLFNPEMISGYEYKLGVDVWYIIAACLLFLLSYVFSYGEELQRESDETL